MPSPFQKPDLASLALQFINGSQAPKTLPTPRRIRILFKGVYIADTCSSSSSTGKFVWEHPHYPYYYLPLSAFPFPPSENTNSPEKSDVQWKLLEDVKQSDKANGNSGESRHKDTVARIWQLTVLDKSTDRVLEFVHGGPDGSLAGLVRFEFSAADLWLEEDTPIQIHPKDPFKRIDTLHSLRPIKISIPLSSGSNISIPIASSSSSVHLYETSLPTRYYIPFSTIDPKLLRRSETRTSCPYKGGAEYYDVVLTGDDGKEEVKKDLVWYYRAPLVECAAIAGLACFYNEKVKVEVDGVIEILDGKSPFA